MKRFLLIFPVLFLLLAMTVVCVGAEEVQTDAEVITETADTADVGFGTVLLNVLEEHVGEIFSALTLVASLLLAYFYKRGLLPVIWNGLERIRGASEEAGTVAAAIAKTCDDKMTAFCDMATPFLEGIGAVGNTVESLSQFVKDMETRLEAAEGERVRMKLLMTGVADMLWGVFSAANLPQYAKEQLGQRYNALMAALSADAEVENDGQEETPAV